MQHVCEPNRAGACDDAPMRFPESMTGDEARFERWSFERHTSALTEMSADPEVMRFLGGPQSAAAAQETSRRLAGHWATFGFGLWAVIDPDGECVGFAGLSHPWPGWQPDLSGEVEVGWRLARGAWGRGYATDGGRLALEASTERLGLERVISIVAPGNVRSLAVTGRLGMTPSGRALNGRLDLPVDLYEKRIPVPAA
jgi:RimJ/RimL family protein N-acetyltransferase